MKDYVLQIKVRNGPLLRAMREEGYQTASALSRASGVSQGDVGQMLGLTKPPMLANGKWATAVLRVSECLRRMPEDLFPPQHLEAALKRSQVEVEAGLDDLALFIEAQATPEQLLAKSEGAGTIEAALATLSPRGREVLRRRFGLDGEPETYEQIAVDYGVTRERVRQIEQSALRRLRHPSVSKGLRDVIDVVAS